MAHWDGLNLDWLPADMGPSPKPGMLSEDVRRDLGPDPCRRRGERRVRPGRPPAPRPVQHRRTTRTGPRTPGTRPTRAASSSRPPTSSRTRTRGSITLVKYRYIVARWGWSPAVVAWELFNEVHWTDAFRQGREADVARWHGEMADFIRSVDVYGHLDHDEHREPPEPDLREDGLLPAAPLRGQPDRRGAQHFDPACGALDRPVFYGEEGDDHQPLPAEVKKSGLNLVPPVWASIMGQGAMAAQPWDGWHLLEQNRLDELGAVFRFLAINRIAAQQGLAALLGRGRVRGARAAEDPCRAGVAAQGRARFRLSRSTGPSRSRRRTSRPRWRRPPPSAADGFPGRATYHLDLPAQDRRCASASAPSARAWRGCG